MDMSIAEKAEKMRVIMGLLGVKKDDPMTMEVIGLPIMGGQEYTVMRPAEMLDNDEDLACRWEGLMGLEESQGRTLEWYFNQGYELVSEEEMVAGKNLRDLWYRRRQQRLGVAADSADTTPSA